MPIQQVILKDLGRIPYKEAWDIQSGINAELIRDKRAHGEGKLPHQLLICEHDPVYTLGKSGSEANLRIELDQLSKINATYFKINRGGDITFHGPGQLVVYPIFDLDRFFTDVHKYVRMLEETIIRLLDTYGLQGKRLEGYTGVWLNDDKGWRKLCAIGVHLSRWVTMHGLALNVNTELDYFDNIIPCGIAERDKSVTSMRNELNQPLSMEEVKSRLQSIFADLFEFDYYTQSDQ